MIFSNKSQMIHVISEVVVLIGFTFYFTSKINKLYDDLTNTNKIIKSQNDRINNLENIINKIMTKISLLDYSERNQSSVLNRQATSNLQKIEKETVNNLENSLDNIEILSFDTKSLDDNEKSVSYLDTSDNTEILSIDEKPLNNTEILSINEKPLENTEILSIDEEKPLDDTIETVPIDELDKELYIELEELKNEEENID